MCIRDKLTRGLNSKYPLAEDFSIVPLISAFVNQKTVRAPVLCGYGTCLLYTSLGQIQLFQIGIPAFTGLYFDWFGGCIQAFIFCTLTAIFIKRAAGEE